MLCNMESAAADTFEALLRASPPLPKRPPFTRDENLDRMRREILPLIEGGGSVSREDMKRYNFTDAEIDQLFEIACRHALIEHTHNEARGIRRARVPAGRAQNP